MAEARYKDLDLTLTILPTTKKLAKLEDETAVKRALKHIILLSNGDYPFSPEIGSRVKSLLFEPATFITSTLLQTEIEDLIRNFEPRIDLLGVVVDPNLDENRFDITITFNILNRIEPVSVSFFLNRTR